jgi:hypothetical protein
LKEVEMRKLAAKENKEVRRLEKLQREKKCRERAEQHAANKREKQY